MQTALLHSWFLLDDCFICGSWSFYFWLYSVKFRWLITCPQSSIFSGLEIFLIQIKHNKTTQMEEPHPLSSNTESYKGETSDTVGTEARFSLRESMLSYHETSGPSWGGWEIKDMPFLIFPASGRVLLAIQMVPKWSLTLFTQVRNNWTLLENLPCLIECWVFSGSKRELGWSASSWFGTRVQLEWRLGQNKEWTLAKDEPDCLGLIVWKIDNPVTLLCFFFFETC